MLTYLLTACAIQSASPLTYSVVIAPGPAAPGPAAPVPGVVKREVFPDVLTDL
jgi:hypothetical protein